MPIHHQTCKHCGTDLGLYKGRGQPLSRCAECKRVANNRYQREHRQTYKRDYQLSSRQEARRLVREARQKPCVDCGIQLPYECMDLDHVRGEKAFNFGHAHKVAGAGPTFIEKMKQEIDKCEVRCANCHRLRHYHERVN